MTINNYKIGTCSTNNSDFGGLIFNSDFNTNIPQDNFHDGSRIAARIFSDWKFDQECKRNTIIRDNKNLLCKEK